LPRGTEKSHEISEEFVCFEIYIELEYFSSVPCAVYGAVSRNSQIVSDVNLQVRRARLRARGGQI
jgi:hypothetical protein